MAHWFINSLYSSLSLTLALEHRRLSSDFHNSAYRAFTQLQQLTQFDRQPKWFITRLSGAGEFLTQCVLFVGHSVVSHNLTTHMLRGRALCVQCTLDQCVCDHLFYVRLSFALNMFQQELSAALRVLHTFILHTSPSIHICSFGRTNCFNMSNKRTNARNNGEKCPYDCGCDARQRHALWVGVRCGDGEEGGMHDTTENKWNRK